jgi:hypothetical protein
VGPRIKELRKYETWTSEVYGELTPRFVSEIIRVSGLGPGKQFMDLGSGVGNVVLQAALESGCEAYGIEINPAPAEIAKGFQEQFEMRCKMWGVCAGSVELEEGSMLESRRVDELLPKADVVLVNNKVFLESREFIKPPLPIIRSETLTVGDSERVPPTQVPRPEGERDPDQPQAVLGPECAPDGTERGRHVRDLRRVRAALPLGSCLLGLWRRNVLRPPRGPDGVRGRQRAVREAESEAGEEREVHAESL